ncbi:hypothetical protein MLR35_12955, partial [Escherichia coli]|nr:hypothetical protein [Escherichia coli]
CGVSAFTVMEHPFLKPAPFARRRKGPLRIILSCLNNYSVYYLDMARHKREYFNTVGCLRCSGNTSQPAGKAANQTSNKKPPNSAVFYCL